MEKDYSFALLSESWTQESQENTTRYRISKYFGVFDSREDGYGGAAIYVKNTINFTRIPLPNLSDNTQAVAVMIPKWDIVVASIYISPTAQINELEDDLTSIFVTFKKHKKVLLGGDWNAHHVSWGDKQCDRKGGVILELINSYSLLILIDGSCTFKPVQLNKRSTAIDLTVCTPDLYGLLYWKVLDYGVGSYHMAIKTRYENTTIPAKARWIYNRQQINQSLARMEANNIHNCRDMTRQVQQVTRASRKRDNYSPKYWWSHEVEEAWKKKQDAWREFNRVASVENLIKLKKAAAVFQRLKKIGKQKKLDEFVEQINPLTSSRELWRMVGRLTGKKIGKKENNPMLDDETMADKFMDLHFGSNTWMNDIFDGSLAVGYDILDKEKWYQILNSKKPDSATAEDKITYGMLRILNTEVTEA